MKDKCKYTSCKCQPEFGKWIPVTERLPEVEIQSGEFVPVLMLFNSQVCFGKIEHSDFVGESRFMEIDAWQGSVDFATPTHWMILPDPPKK